MPSLRIAPLALIASLSACGGAAVSAAPPAPRFIAGGGVGDGPITTGLNVYVADESSRQPISGARVRVGASADPEACTATTDSTGLAVFAAPACAILGGKQSVTSSAAGYAPSTWIGVDAANLTMTIRPTTTPLYDSAIVTGTIAGWGALPAPATNHATLAIVGASSAPELDDANNNLPQDMRNVVVTLAGDMIELPVASNVCIRNAYANDCSWRLKTRTGPQAHYAVVLDQDTKGTDKDDTDDTYTVIGWALKRGLSFTKDQGADGESLTLIGDADMQPFNVSFPTPPPGIDFAQAFPILQLGAEGRVAIALPALDATHLMTRVPKLTGAFADAKYDLLAKVQDAKDKDQPATVSWAHAIDATKPATAPNWLALPTGLAASGGTYSFTAVAGATVHGAELQTMAGKRGWSVTIFDGTTSFTLPGVSPDPLPAGPSLFVVSAIEVPGLKLDDAQFDHLRDTLTHVSSDQIMFTH